MATPGSNNNGRDGQLDLGLDQGTNLQRDTQGLGSLGLGSDQDEQEIGALAEQEAIKTSRDNPELQDFLNKINQQRQQMKPAAEVTKEDIVGRFFNPTAPAEQLSREDIFPGITEGLQVGTIGTPSLGSTPIFFGGGGQFPFEMVNSRRRALNNAAKKGAAQKAKLAAMLTPPETAQQFQSRLNDDFIDFTDGIYGQLAGNQSVLADPTNPIARRVLQRYSNFELQARWGTRLDTLAKDVRTAFDDPKKIMTKEGASVAERILTGDVDLEEEDLGELVEKMQLAQSTSALLDSGYIDNVQAKVRTWLKKIPEADDSSVSGFDILKKMKETFLDKGEKLNIATQLFAFDERSWKANGFHEPQDLLPLIEPLIEDKMEQTIAGFRTDFGGSQGKQSGTNIYLDYQRRGQEAEPDLITITTNPELSRDARNRAIINTFKKTYGAELPEGQKELSFRVDLTPEDKAAPVDETVSDMEWFDEKTGSFIRHSDYIRILKEREAAGEDITDEQSNVLLLPGNEVIPVQLTGQRTEWSRVNPDGTFTVLTAEEIADDPGVLRIKREITVNEYDMKSQISGKQRAKIKNLLDSVPGIEISKGFPRSVRSYNLRQAGTPSTLGSRRRSREQEFRAIGNEKGRGSDAAIVTEILNE